MMEGMNRIARQGMGLPTGSGDCGVSKYEFDKVIKELEGKIAAGGGTGGTGVDLSSYAKKEDLSTLATKVEVALLPTKEDLSGLATKIELGATRATISRLDQRDNNLEKMVTDNIAETTRLLTSFGSLSKSQSETRKDVTDNKYAIGANTSRMGDFETKLKTIELNKTVSISVDLGTLIKTNSHLLIDPSNMDKMRWGNATRGDKNVTFVNQIFNSSIYKEPGVKFSIRHSGRNLSPLLVDEVKNDRVVKAVKYDIPDGVDGNFTSGTTTLPNMGTFYMIFKCLKKNTTIFTCGSFEIKCDDKGAIFVINSGDESQENGVGGDGMAWNTIAINLRGEIYNNGQNFLRDSVSLGQPGAISLQHVLVNKIVVFPDIHDADSVTKYYNYWNLGF